MIVKSKFCPVIFSIMGTSDPIDIVRPLYDAFSDDDKEHASALCSDDKSRESLARQFSGFLVTKFENAADKTIVTTCVVDKFCDFVLQEW